MGGFRYWLARLRLALISTLTPWVAVRMLKAENAMLCKQITDPLLTGIEIGNGSIDIGFEGGAAQLLAGMYVGMLDKYPDAKNYIAFMTKKYGGILVTVQKKSGKTPHQLLIEAKREMAAFGATSREL